MFPIGVSLSTHAAAFSMSDVLHFLYLDSTHPVRIKYCQGCFFAAQVVKREQWVGIDCEASCGSPMSSVTNLHAVLKTLDPSRGAATQIHHRGEDHRPPNVRGSCDSWGAVPHRKWGKIPPKLPFGEANETQRKFPYPKRINILPQTPNSPPTPKEANPQIMSLLLPQHPMDSPTAGNGPYPAHPTRCSKHKTNDTRGFPRARRHEHRHLRGDLWDLRGGGP